MIVNLTTHEIDRIDSLIADEIDRMEEDGDESYLPLIEELCTITSKLYSAKRKGEAA